MEKEWFEGQKVVGVVNEFNGFNGFSGFNVFNVFSLQYPLPSVSSVPLMPSCLQASMPSVFVTSLILPFPFLYIVS